jgi:hypothetical protein
MHAIAALVLPGTLLKDSTERGVRATPDSKAAILLRQLSELTSHEN